MIFLVNSEVRKNSYSSGVIHLASDLLLLNKTEPGEYSGDHNLTMSYTVCCCGCSDAYLFLLELHKNIAKEEF